MSVALVAMSVLEGRKKLEELASAFAFGNLGEGEGEPKNVFVLVIVVVIGEYNTCTPAANTYQPWELSNRSLTHSAQGYW